MPEKKAGPGKWGNPKRQSQCLGHELLLIINSHESRVLIDQQIHEEQAQQPESGIGKTVRKKRSTLLFLP